MNKRIGIFSGAFNPIHSGHIGFAIQSLKDAKLDQVYLMPERHHPNKPGNEHYAHRLAMITQAIKPHNRLAIIDSNERTFHVNKTLPMLQAKFKGDELVYLLGSDVLRTINQWPNVERLLTSMELVVGIRENDQDIVPGLINNLPIPPQKVYLINSYAPGVSSTKVRSALRNQHHTDGVLTSVRNYSNRHWLYVSLS